MEHLKTATTALKALMELGYPLELQRVVNYLENLGSKDEVIQFDNEDALSSFLQKYPSMFWVQGSKVFPAQMKPKGKLKSSPQTQSQQSHSKVQTVSDSNDTLARQQEQKICEVEGDKKKSRIVDADDNVDQAARLEEDSIRAIAAVLKREGPMRLKALLRSVHGLPSELRSFVGKDKESVIEFILEHPDVFLIDDDDVVFHESTVHKEAVQQFKSVLQSKGKLPVNKLTGLISTFRYKTEILWFIGGSPSAVEKFLRGYPNTFRVDDSGTVSLINTKTKQPASTSACSAAKSKSTNNTTKVAVKLKVPHGMSEQPKVNKENKLLQEGVKHFKGVLQVKGSMPMDRLFGHVNQCRNEVKRAIGTYEKEVKKFLLNYPEVFSISKKGNVQLVSSKGKQQQVNPGKDKLLSGKSTSNIKCGTKQKTKDVCTKSTIVPSEETLQEAKLDNITKKTVDYFKVILSKKGPSTIHVLSTYFGQCGEDIRMHVGSTKEGLTKFLREHPQMFKIDEKTDHIAHIDTAALQGVDELATNAQKDRNDLLVQDISRSSCHNWFNPPKSHDSEVKHTVDQIDPVENQEEPDEEVDPVDVKRETSELIFDLVQRCGEISFSSLQGYINLLSEDRQECIKDRGGLLSFLEHDQRFKIDHVSESISLKRLEETEPDSLTNTDKKEQQHLSTEASVKEEVEKTDISIDEPSMKAGNCDAENQHTPNREPGDDTGTSLLKTSHTTEDQHDCVDVSTVVTPSDLVTSETNVDISVSPVQTLSMLAGSDLNQEQTSCDSATAVPTATVHPMAVTNDSSLLSTEDGSRMDHDSRPVGVSSDDLSTESRMNVAVQTEETGTVSQVSQSSTAEDTDSLLPSSVDRTQARSTSDPVQGRPLHLLVGEDGTRVWENSGQQDMQPLTAVCPTEGIVPVANPPGLPDDFTSLLPMFKDNLRPIQDSLVEVEMDIGRVPIARYYSPESPLLAATRLSEQTLTRETLETILFALPLERSAIGQGRVLLRGSFHWISTLKNSLGEVVGLTLRRGHAVPGCLDLLWDVVTSGTSTLIVGRPCSGKTTLLREWARVLSDVCYRRVIVVDTLNEIAGGDDIPHSGIGGARRVQVHNRCEQVSQLQTAARNHSPDCIIVDEVQTQEEVNALQAIRLTGVQVVAGVCAGCLTDLLHNSVMRGLLGLSDPPSSTSAPLGVSQQPLTFLQTLPVFQTAVTIHNRDTVSVYPDIASFVRVWLSEGRFPLAQHRKRVVTRDRETEL
ncbi:Hypp3196 [Branchiostoma lanceolatum]|uniref:Hypp3196 protein n=1 Tax=Branchiostoma lanceolatum TaxID=7740 RepID=A0A8K0EW85_BRALA|nr:Hypp3196 [Branchiostoma lanceolatum]